MGVKIKHTDPTLNSFSTDDLVVNVQSGSLFFKSNTKIYKIQGDDLNTTSIIEGPLLSGSAGLNNLTDAYSRDTSLGLGTDALKNDDGTTNVNTAVGIFSATANVDGIGNTAIGNSSLNSNVSGQANTAVGASAFVALNNSGTGKNIGIGFAAGNSIVTGTNNTIIGSVAGTSGLSNTIIVAAGSTERFRVNSSGNMGIGTDNPTSKLDVNGTVTATGTNFASDINLKTNINNIETPLETISKLKGVTFDWKDPIIKTDKTLQGTKHGLIAQEVEKILPNLVHTNKTKSVSYIEIIPILIEAIKEQQNQIDELKSKINE